MDINEYIKSNLRPTENEEGVIQSTINSVTTILQKDSNLSVAKCLPGGSFAKGTMLRGNFEGDVVYIINKDKNFDFDKLMNYVLKLIQGNFQDVIEVKIEYKSVKLVIQKPIGKVCFDILPAYEINSPLQMSQVINEKYFAGSSTKFQVEYVKMQKNTINYFDDLIRLLKLWKKLYNVNLSGYQLELIAANAHNGQPIQYWKDVLLACFNKIISMINGVVIYPINWNYFTNNQITAAKSNYGISIVDPGNPANNVGANLRQPELEQIKTQTNFAINMLNANKMNELLTIK